MFIFAIVDSIFLSLVIIVLSIGIVPVILIGVFINFLTSVGIHMKIGLS